MLNSLIRLCHGVCLHVLNPKMINHKDPKADDIVSGIAAPSLGSDQTNAEATATMAENIPLSLLFVSFNIDIPIVNCASGVIMKKDIEA